ncbi:hypothetical protein U1Q18_038650 [Sarracenia purpurea var. burkii]
MALCLMAVLQVLVLLLGLVILQVDGVLLCCRGGLSGMLECLLWGWLIGGLLGSWPGCSSVLDVLVLGLLRVCIAEVGLCYNSQGVCYNVPLGLFLQLVGMVAVAWLRVVVAWELEWLQLAGVVAVNWVTGVVAV